jgi:hypothetical protein
MRGSLLTPILMIAFATASSVTLLRDASLRYVSRSPQIVGALDAGLTSLRRIVPPGETLGLSLIEAMSKQPTKDCAA